MYNKILVPIDMAHLVEGKSTIDIAIELDEAHMVLAYYPSAGAEPLILDNLVRKIRPAGARDDLVPVYSFNGADLWLAVNRLEGEKVGKADRISRWQAYQAKLMQQMAVDR